MHSLNELNPLIAPEENSLFPSRSYDTNEVGLDFLTIDTITADYEQKDYSKANRLNEYYSQKIGWGQFIYEINDLLLKSSGKSGMSLYGDAFASAVQQWQLKNGFSGKDADGIIGTASWKKMQLQLPTFVASSITPATPPTTSGSVTTPVISGSQRKPTPGNYLSVSENEKKTKSNLANLLKAGVSFNQLLGELNKYVDCNYIYNELLAYNARSTGNKYQINFPVSQLDATVTEAIHQIQIYFYNDQSEQDGILGPSTLETLGFLKHNLRRSTSALSVYKAVLKQMDKEISSSSNGEFTAGNWFDHIIEPAFLGTKIERGVHIIFHRQLKSAENYILSLPQYSGLSNAEAGKKLGIQRITGCRSDKEKQAMHAYGLAIDVDIELNPYLGAPWVKYDKVKLTEKYRILDVLKKAGSPNLSGGDIFEYLHSIASSHGKDSAKVFGVLKQNHNEFVQYLSANPTELKFWQQSATFENKTAAKGFLNHHPDLVYALRQVVKLAWGATDFGPNASGDIMHFDMRTIGFGPKLCTTIGGYVPKPGSHPAFELTESEEYEFDGNGISSEEFLGIAFENPEYYELNDNPVDFAGEQERVETEGETEAGGAGSIEKAVKANQKYASSLGWSQFYDQINDLVLPYSGQSNVSLGENDFVSAVAGWQRAQGFSPKDCDGIIGPVTWRAMQLQLHAVFTPSTPAPAFGTTPGINDPLRFNQYYASKIVDRMNQGLLGSRFNAKQQLEAIAQGHSVLQVNPNSQIIQILPVIYHIGEVAAAANYREIVIGSFIRAAAANGSCTGHCAGRCIDINHSKRDFSDPASTQMVIAILESLGSLDPQFKISFGFGLPFQGEFFKNKSLPKFKSAPAAAIGNNRVAALVQQLGIVFPDNDNHLHIQVKWM